MQPQLRSFALHVAEMERARGANETSCREVLAVIQCYVDVECDLWTMLAIAAHLDCCRTCAEELQALRWLKAAVRRCAAAPESPLWH
jgi:hypothetical protein